MKTAEQFLEECKARWTLSTPENAKQAMIEALILYAEQAIDECANSAETIWETDYFEDEWKIIDRDSILKVKNKLI